MFQHRFNRGWTKCNSIVWDESPYAGLITGAGASLAMHTQGPDHGCLPVRVREAAHALSGY